MTRPPKRTRITATDVRDLFSEVLNRVAYRGDHITLTRHGQDVAVMIPLEDYERYNSVSGSSGEKNKSGNE